MELNLNNYFSITVISILVLVAYPYVKSKFSKYRYPPGPTGLPILGVGPFIPAKFPGPTLQKWAQKYGEMMTLQLGGMTWVYLNSSRVGREILDRRSGITSSRPAFPLIQDILSNGKRLVPILTSLTGSMVLMPYNDTWRSIRKIMHQLLTAKQAETYRPYQDAESKQLLWDYLHDPEHFHVHNGRYANSVIMSVVFGKRTRSDDPNVIQLFGTIDDFLGNTTPGKWLVESFPQLSRIPHWMQWWRPFGEDGYRRTIGVYNNFFEEFEKSVADGTSKECFATKFNSIVEKYDFDPAQQNFIAGTVVEAGSDTTRNQNNLLVAAATVDMSWVHRVRKDLDRVCGANAERLPTYDDIDELPIIYAVVKETLRWRPNITEAGFPHGLTEDLEFEGYRFEKGTIFSWNSWNICMNPEEYEDPQEFKPERYMDEHVYDTLQGHFGFGAGRRICVGYHVAARNMFIVFARVLYCFDFIEDPNEPVDTMRIPMQTGSKAPFKTTIRPRSQAHADLILRECKAVADELEQLNLDAKKQTYKATI